MDPSELRDGEGPLPWHAGDSIDELITSFAIQQDVATGRISPKTLTAYNVAPSCAKRPRSQPPGKKSAYNPARFFGGKPLSAPSLFASKAAPAASSVQPTARPAPAPVPAPARFIAKPARSSAQALKARGERSPPRKKHNSAGLAKLMQYQAYCSGRGDVFAAASSSSDQKEQRRQQPFPRKPAQSKRKPLAKRDAKQRSLTSFFSK